MLSQTIKDLPCPDTISLQRFLNDELPEGEAGRMQQHVDACPACQLLIEKLVGGLPGPGDVLTPLFGTLSAGKTVVPPPSAPIEIPGYEVLGEIGRGGMGVVYKARHLRLDRIVALKMLLSGGHAGAKARSRFLHEAEAVAQLQHPHIVPLYEAGQHGELPYFTMEFASAGSLADLLEGKPLPPRDAGRLVEQLARGMQHAHERGIVHRDLKPGNVLLQPVESSSSVQSSELPAVAMLKGTIPKITDFGLAKNITVGTALTSQGAVFGTPSYMAPEQAAGDIKEVGPAADIYALGAILYECLSGRPPFRGPTTADTLLQVLTDDPVPLSRLQRSVPKDLETICLKCLRKKPHQRYTSAQELADDLRSFQAGEPIRARPVGRGERFVMWCMRRPMVAALLTALVVLTLVGGSAVIWQWREAVTSNESLDAANRDLTSSNTQLVLARKDADARRQQAEDERQIAQAARKFLQIDLLRQANPTEQANRLLTLGGDRFQTSENPTIKELLDRAATELTPDKIEQKFPGQPLVQAEVLYTVGTTYLGVGDFDSSARHLERARAIYEDKLGPDHADTLMSMNDLGEAYISLQKLELALPLVEDTLKRRRAKLGPDHPHTLESANGLALAYVHAGKGELAVLMLEDTLKRYEAKLAADPESLANTFMSMNNLGLVYMETGKLDLALPLLKKSHQLMSDKLGSDHPNTLISLTNLSMAYREAGKLDLALTLAEESLKRMTAKLGPNHPNTFLSMQNLAECYRIGNKLDLALPLYQESLKRMKAKFGPDHANTLLSMNYLALGYHAAGQSWLALPLLEETLKLRKARLGPDNPATLISMNNLVLGYFTAGKHNLALPLCEEAFKLMKARLGLDHPVTLTCMSNLGECYRTAKKLDLAVPLHEEALERRKARLGVDHLDTLISLNNLALSYYDSGKKDRAVPLWTDAHQLAAAMLGPDHPTRSLVLENLLTVLFDTRQYDKVPALISADVAGKRALYGATDPRFVQALANASLKLLQARHFVEAELLLRECLPIREKTEPESWATFNTKAMLGGSLLGQKKNAEAEPLLWAGYQGMKEREQKIPDAGKGRLTDAEGWLAELLEATRDQKETRLQGKLADAKTEVVHEVKLTAGKPAVILMQSNEFDTYLRIEDTKGKVLAENDDITFASNNLNSRILFVPAADGVYRIVATSYQQAGRGAYDIIIHEYAATRSK